MNKPVAIICGCVAGLGLLILAQSAFLTVAYGRGNMEAGNFNRCWYSVARDAQTGRMVRAWDIRGESTEDSIVDRLNMWLVGMGLVAVGAGIYVWERAARHAHHKF